MSEIIMSLLGSSYSKSDIRKCISKTSKTYKLSEKDVELIVMEMLTAKEGKMSEDLNLSINFVDEPYFVNIDDQKHLVVSDENQEYKNKDFKKSLFYKFPVLDENSEIPKSGPYRTSYQNMKYWHIQKSIKEQLPKLENTNWSNQTLSYSRNNVTAKHIVNCVVAPLLEKGLFPNKKINVVDTTGNIGMDSINFALEKFVSHVTTYEILENVYAMLVQNIKLYGLSDKITAINKRFEASTVGDILKDALVLIDPPYEVGNNATNFNLSIDSKPIYYVVQEILDQGAKCVILTMPKKYKYNYRFAKDNGQFVLIYQMGKINNKLFVVTRDKDAQGLGKFGDYYTVDYDETQLTWNGKVNFFACKSMLNKVERFVTKPINLKIDPQTKKKILIKIFGEKGVVYNGGANNINNLNIIETLKSHINTQESDQWGYGKSTDNFAKKNSNLLKFIDPTTSAPIGVYVDIGCGSGTDIEGMNKKFTIKESICIDIRDFRINKSASEFLDAKQVLNLPENYANIITIFHTLHHILDVTTITEYLKEIYRITAKDGYVLIKDHDIRLDADASNVDFEHAAYAVSSWKKGVQELLKNYDKIEPMIYYSSEEIINAMEKVGFILLYSGNMSKINCTYGAVFQKK